MNRDELAVRAIKAISENRFLIAELATGTGKSKIAIDCINRICDTVYKYEGDTASCLIVVPKKTNILSWREELDKWGVRTDRIELCCYASMKKYTKLPFDIIVFDECHHLCTEKKYEELKDMSMRKAIFLSASLPKNLKDALLYMERKTCVMRMALTDAIENNILPEPRIFLIPMDLDNTSATERMMINESSKNVPVEIDYNKIWTYRKNKLKAQVRLTKRQFINEMDSKIEFYKRKIKAGAGIMAKNRMLKLCTERLKTLSEYKNDDLERLLGKIHGRTIIMCSSIAQAEKLCGNSIHTKNTDSVKVLERFNSGEIDTISACNMLNEGVNPKECRNLVFANINSSDILQVQRMGRALRHPDPVVFIPYYRLTREEEIVDEWMVQFRPETIKKITMEEIKDDL